MCLPGGKRFSAHSAGSVPATHLSAAPFHRHKKCILIGIAQLRRIWPAVYRLVRPEGAEAAPSRASRSRSTSTNIQASGLVRIATLGEGLSVGVMAGRSVAYRLACEMGTAGQCIGRGAACDDADFSDFDIKNLDYRAAFGGRRGAPRRRSLAGSRRALPVRTRGSR